MEKNPVFRIKVHRPFMTLYYDHEHKQDDADIECAFSISGRIVIRDPHISTRTMPKGRCLSITHKGFFADLALAWTRLLAYAGENNFEISDSGTLRGSLRFISMTGPLILVELQFQ
jgi:effector-binding domain-containing protein